MVLYFTGTGNSRYVAERIASIINDDCVNLFERLRTNDISEIKSDRDFVIVSPTYGWQIPHILRDWLKGVKLSGSRRIYFVMTCGGEIDNAPKYLSRLCAEKNMEYMGCSEIVMPENYIALFDAPEKTEALEIIESSEPNIEKTGQIISSGKAIPEKSVGAVGKIKSSIVNAVYYPMLIHSKKFAVSDNCISCGKCVKSCVMNNIKLVDGKPAWTDNCTHCMACICSCPKSAIEYGKASVGKPRYTCPK
ncbi:MAG: EFR1 family ferrodoxin [Eubacterium sp.]